MNDETQIRPITVLSNAVALLQASRPAKRSFQHPRVRDGLKRRLVSAGVITPGIVRRLLVTH